MDRSQRKHESAAEEMIERYLVLGRLGFVFWYKEKNRGHAPGRELLSQLADLAATRRVNAPTRAVLRIAELLM